MFKEFISIFNPKNLPNINKTFWVGVKYTLLAVSLVVMAWLLTLFGFVFYKTGSLSLEKNINNFADQLMQSYPDNLVLTMDKDGNLSKNIPEPVIIKNDEKLTGKDHENLLVLDDQVTASIENLEKYGTGALIARNGFIAVGNDNKIQGFSFKQIIGQSNDSGEQFQGYVLDKAKLVDIKNQHLPKIINLIVPSVIVLILISVPLLVIGLSVVHIIWTVIIACVLWLIFKLFRNENNYEESYNIALYTGVPSIILGSALDYFYPISLIQTLLTVIFVIISYFIIKK